MSRAQYQREYRAKNREKVREKARARYYVNRPKALAYAAKWRAEHREQGVAATLKWRNKTGYKTQPQRRAKLEAIAGRPRPDKCEVCGDGGKIVFEHDHTTGKFRGWLCGGCNTTLGMVQERPEVLRALALYLEKYRE